MRYKDKDGNPVSGFFDLNKEMIKINEDRSRVCMNPDCYMAPVLQKYKCTVQRPLIYLGRRCWNCKETKYLEEYKK